MDDSARKKRRGVMIGFAATLGVAAAIVTPAVMDSSAAPAGKVTICHRTDSETNPYVTITIAYAAAYSGHYLQHQGDVWYPGHPKEPKWGDIIPPSTYKGHQFSENWTTDGQAIYNNGCSTVSPGPTSSVPMTGPGTGTA